MNIIAHRGDHTHHPGNTMQAFQAALDAGLFGIEFDVRLTADKVPVVFHPYTLIGTTGSGIFATHTHKEIKELRLLSSEGEEYEIPTLQQVLDVFGKKLYLEIHVQSIAPETIAVIGNMLKKNRRLLRQLEVTSFEPAILLGLKMLTEGALLTDVLLPSVAPWMTPEVTAHMAVEKARLAGARGIHFHPSQLTPESVEYIRSNDLEIHCWDINTQEQLSFIQSLQITQFGTDTPHLFLNQGSLEG